MLAALFVDLGRPREALAHAQASLEFAREAGEARSEAYAAQVLATVHYAAGRWQPAADLYRQVVAVPPGLGDRYPAVEARIEAIGCYASQVRPLFRDAARLSKMVRRHVRRAGGERLWRRTGLTTETER